MGDLKWTQRRHFGFPEKAMRTHAVIFGSTGSGKTETELRIAYGGHKIYHRQVIYLDAKGETKREDEMQQDNAARFVAAMHAAGARSVYVFPALYYNGWQGTPQELKNRLLAVVDYSESPFYGDVAANALDLALSAPTTPRSSSHFLANLRYERLKAIYKDDPRQYQRVLDLDKHQLAQVEMRYQVFFSAVAGQLDGKLDYADADAVYLRIRGFTLHNEAPRLGRFFVMDFIHYIAERRRPGVQTLFIIDEFNALRMREETSILFEQVRSFGGNLIISAQGYAGLGPHEYAERILDACPTHVLHACSDPGPVARRAGKKFFLDVSWSEDEEGIPRKHIRPKWDWRIPETAVMQQEEGQAFWSYRGRSQHVQTARVPITAAQIAEAWREMHRQEDIQRLLLEVEARRRAEQQAAKAQQNGNKAPGSQAGTPNAAATPQPAGSKRKGPKSSASTTRQPPQNAAPGAQITAPAKASPSRSLAGLKPERSPAPPVIPPIPAPPPTPDPDDDEPDRL
jgi:hypothetical protein